MADQVLDTYGTVTLDASGHGRITMQPEGFRTWNVTSINVSTDQATTTTPVPRCVVYLGSVGPGQIKAQTWMGNGSTAVGQLQVQPSQPLIIEWTGGVPGSHATASVYGTQAMR